MKLKFAAVLVLLLSQLAIAQNITEPMPGSLAYLDAHYGFRDLQLEQPLVTCEGMLLVEGDGDLKFYTRKNDNMALGETKLTHVEYSFYKGKLASVTVSAEGKTNCVALLKHLEKYYGPGRKSPRGDDKYYWFGQRVTVDYVTYSDGEKASSGMWSKPLQALQESGRKPAPQQKPKAQ